MKSLPLRLVMNVIVRFLLVAVISALPTAWAGHGVGAGDGFPTVEFPQQTLTTFPANEAFDGFTLALAKRFPTVAAKIRELKTRFLTTPGQYELVHLLGSYPYQLANSRHSDRPDQWGIPHTVRITVWNEFIDAGVDRQTEALVHEFTHILLTGDHEEQTVRVTNLLLAASHPEFSEELQGQLAQALSSLIPTERTTPAVPLQIQNSTALDEDVVFTATRSLYMNATETTRVCQDYEQGPWISLGTQNFQFPQVPTEFQSRLQRDPFFKIHRNLCLKQTPEGRSLIDGFVTHPYFHFLFLKALLRKDPFVILKHDTSEMNPRLPNSEGVTSLFQDLLHLTQGQAEALHINESSLVGLIAGYEDWRSLRRQFLTPPERVSSFHYSASEALRFFPQWVQRLQGSSLTINAGPPQNTWQFGIFRTEEGSSATCRFLANSVVNCSYDTPGFLGLWRNHSEQRWVLDLEWMAAAVNASFGSSRDTLYSWLGVVIETDQTQR